MATEIRELLDEGAARLGRVADDPRHEAVILLGFDGDGTPRTRKPRRAITLRHLLTHTSGFSYDLYFDEVTEVDQRFVLAGVDVVVDEMSLMYLIGTEIDYVEGLQGAGFKFHNPNVKSTCGCGSSFSV